MGDRANIVVHDTNWESTVYLYTHWGGTELPKTLAAALDRGRGRWDDGCYLARIIFSEMVRDDIDGETGFGITSTVGDGRERLLFVRVPQQTVSINDGAPIPFDEFIRVADTISF